MIVFNAKRAAAQKMGVKSSFVLLFMLTLIDITAGDT